MTDKTKLRDSRLRVNSGLHRMGLAMFMVDRKTLDRWADVLEELCPPPGGGFKGEEEE